MLVAAGLIVFMPFQLSSKLYKHTKPRIGFLKIIFAGFSGGRVVEEVKYIPLGMDKEMTALSSLLE